MKIASYNPGFDNYEVFCDGCRKGVVVNNFFKHDNGTVTLICPSCGMVILAIADKGEDC